MEPVIPMEKASHALSLIEHIQSELKELKRLLEEEGASSQVELEGLWEGLQVDETLFEEAERSLFKAAQI